MAVSNSIGSNVFDVLLGLALPWFIKTTFVDYGSVVQINSRGLLYSVVFLFATVALTVITIHCHKWRLTKRLGVMLFCFYAVFLTLSILVELNIFGYVNPPVCGLWSLRCWTVWSHNHKFEMTRLLELRRMGDRTRGLFLPPLPLHLWKDGYFPSHSTKICNRFPWQMIRDRHALIAPGRDWI